MKNITTALVAIAVVAIVGQRTEAEITTGWNVTAQGTQNFLDAANWVNGDVNGVFSSEWTPAGWQVLSFSNDWSGTFSILGNVAKDITAKSSNNGSPRTITLTDDLICKPSASSGIIVFDSTIQLDLGGEFRTFYLYSPSADSKLRLKGSTSNGTLVLSGNGAGLMLAENGRIGGDVRIGTNTTLSINYATANSTIRRVDDVEIHRGIFSLSAYNGNETHEVGTITVCGDEPGLSLMSIAVRSANSATLQTEQLLIDDGALLAIRGDNLGSDTAPSKILFDTAPTLYGVQDGFGTVNTPILQDVVVASGATTALGTFGRFGFATYDPDCGIRALTAGETTSSVTGDSANIVIGSGETLEVNSDASVNSLRMIATAYNDGSAAPALSGSGKLTIGSGMVLVTMVKNGVSLNAPLNFDTVRGRIIAGNAKGDTLYIDKPIYGSGGLVLNKMMDVSKDSRVIPSSDLRGFAIRCDPGDDAYTGDTYIQCVVEVGSHPFLPHGVRSGDTIVNGSLNFGAISINGLYGTGLVRGTTLTVGEDGSDSAFSGTAVLTSSLNITNSTMILDGAVTQGAVNVASDAAIGGDGSIANTLTFANGAKLAVTVADNTAPCLDVAGAVTGGPVTVNVTVTSGKFNTPQRVLKSETPITATFAKGENVSGVELRNGDTELWALPKIGRTVIYLR